MQALDEIAAETGSTTFVKQPALNLPEDSDCELRQQSQYTIQGEGRAVTPMAEQIPRQGREPIREELDSTLCPSAQRALDVRSRTVSRLAQESKPHGLAAATTGKPNLEVSTLS